mgnify:CR=1 FL=1
MAWSWGNTSAWIGKNVGWTNVLGGVLSGASSYLGSRQEGKQQEEQRNFDREAIGLAGAEERKTYGFQKELDKYYVDKDRLERSNALQNFSKYKTNRFPGMDPDVSTLPAPTKPSLTEYNKNG